MTLLPSNSNSVLKGLLIDFYDSFTYNIVAELEGVGLRTEVVAWDDPSIEEKLQLELDSGELSFVVLGPGPGHVSDYSKLFPQIESILKDRLCLVSSETQANDVYLIGICLGHQILGSILGFRISPCEEIFHGVTRSVNLDFFSNSDELISQNTKKQMTQVQCYNSWSLVGSSSDEQAPDEQAPGEKVPSELQVAYWGNQGKRKEVAGLKRSGMMSYQFHPESLGTSYRKQFFLSLKQSILYYRGG